MAAVAWGEDWRWLAEATLGIGLLSLGALYLFRLDRSLIRSGSPRPTVRDQSGKLRLAARACAVIVVVIAIMVEIGWMLHNEELKKIVPGFVAMNPTTALCLLTTAFSLLLSIDSRPGDAARRFARAGALCVSSIALIRIVAYLFQWETRLDQLLFSGQLAALRGEHVNRIAPNTAAGLFLCGLSLASLDARTRRGGRHPSQYLALGVVMISLLALIGYALRLTTFYGVASFIPMALHTAISLGLIGIGLLLARPDHGLMVVVLSDGPAGLMVRRLIPAAILLPLGLGWLRLVGERMELIKESDGLSLVLVSMIYLFLALILWNARLIYCADDDRHRTGEALQASEVFYHSLVESLPQNILRKDLEGRFTFGNQRFCSVMGKTLEEIRGKTDYDLFPKHLAEKYRSDDIQVIRNGVPMDVVEEHALPDGGKQYVQIIKTPLYDPAGSVIGVQVIFWDVTERRRAEEKLQAQYLLLQEMARSEHQAHDELKQAQSRMVQSEKLASLGQMVAGVAHEINNPLSFVGNNIAVLQRDLGEVRELIELYREADGMIEGHAPELAARIRDLNDRADMSYVLDNLQGVLTRSREGLRRIQQIVKDLRVFARLDMSDLNEADLNLGIEPTVNIIRGHANKKQVKIELELQPLPLVICYPAKINQVIMNLVVNAIDACSEGGRVTIRTGTDGSSVWVEVADTGTGIEPGVRDRIFDPFFTTKPVGEGTGLGLSISYGIIQEHGGTIEVESVVGEGSTFRILMPIRHAMSCALPQRRPAEPRNEGAVAVSATHWEGSA